MLAVAWAHDLGAGLRQAFFMFWVTFWPLVLGFALSGAVQTFVPKGRMRRTLGNHQPASILRASGFGMVSSSCSYAAAAMAKSLYQKGADFVTAMVFMFASTNLVIELGVVLVVLLGWQFAAAEFTGGVIMIVLLALTGGLVISRAVLAARGRGQATAAGGENPEKAGSAAPADIVAGAEPDHSDHHASDHHAHDHHAHEHPDEDEAGKPSLRSKAAWADAASYSMADLTMLRRELLVGYLAAGFLAALVPTQVWSAVFLHGHGFWTSLENVLVGPLVAIVSFVCSIGNVPLAAALWNGGISFGGVISFIFADLITIPLLLVYRRYYGRGVALRLLGWFWIVMATAGLAVGGLAHAAGVVPTRRSAQIVADHFEWNYTTVLNIVFLGVLAVLYWLYRNQARLGGGEGYALDPICGMQVRTADAPATAGPDHDRRYFCSDHCRDEFLATSAAASLDHPRRRVRSRS